MGRPVTELTGIYSSKSSKVLCDPQHICDSMYVSTFNQLSLDISKCTQMLQVATTVLQEGFCLLSSAFKTYKIPNGYNS